MKKIFCILLIGIFCFSSLAFTNDKSTYAKEYEDEKISVLNNTINKLSKKDILSEQIFTFNDLKIILNKTTFGEIKNRLKIKNIDTLQKATVSYLDLQVFGIDDKNLQDKGLEHFLLMMVSPEIGTVPDNIDDYIITGVKFELTRTSEINFSINGVDFKNNCDNNAAKKDYFIDVNNSNITIDELEKVYFHSSYYDGWMVECHNLESPYSFAERYMVSNFVNTDLYDFVKDTNNIIPKMEEIKINDEIYRLDGMTLREILKKNYFILPITHHMNEKFELYPYERDYKTIYIIAKDGSVYPIEIILKNMTDKIQNSLDCNIVGIKVSFADLFSLNNATYLQFANGFFSEKIRYSLDEILEIYGEPIEIEQDRYDDRKIYHYNLSENAYGEVSRLSATVYGTGDGNYKFYDISLWFH